jgi:dephospho-CoA kinase
MKHAVFTFGRFNPPTEAGHGKLVNAVKSHAESVGGDHFIFPSHSQDAKKNPLSHEDKVSAMHKVFPKTNIVSHPEVKTAIHAMKHLEKKGYTHATMVVGSDRVPEFKSLLGKYNGKEYNFKKIHVKSAGNRDPDAEGAEGMSASKLRGLVSAGKRDEFISHYSNKKVGAEIHDKVKKAMKEQTTAPIGIFLFGGPGSGKDYVLKNIFSRFDLTEVQADQLLQGYAGILLEDNANIVINCSAENSEQIETIKSMLGGYEFDHVYVSVSNKVSRERNQARLNPLREDVRIGKMLKAERLAKSIPETFTFNNSLNLSESSEMEKVFFASQIQKLLERVVGMGLELQQTPSPKNFAKIRQALGENNVQVSKKGMALADGKEGDCACSGGASGSPCDCGGSCGCAECAGTSKAVKEEASTVKVLNSLKSKIKAKKGVGPTNYDGRLGINIGLISAPTVVGSPTSTYESIQYHLKNNISFTKNIYRPGSEKFFEMIDHARQLYLEGKYQPEDEYELEVLESNIGEIAMYEGKQVVLDFPFEVLAEEGSDPTKGHGIGKPFRKGGGGAVYVKSGDGVKLVNFSQSGMTKKYNDPGRLKSFMARHHCLTNKDKTSASYWACRWPRYFSSGGQQWW